MITGATGTVLPQFGNNSHGWHICRAPRSHVPHYTPGWRRVVRGPIRVRAARFARDSRRVQAEMLELCRTVHGVISAGNISVEHGHHLRIGEIPAEIGGDRTGAE